MATVPRYQPTQTLRPLQVAPENPGVAAQAGSELKMAGGALSSVGQDLGNVALRVQDRENTDAVMRAQSNLVQAESQKSQELQLRLGANAKGTTQEMYKWWGDNAPQYADTLTNSAQRRAFDQFVLQRQPASVQAISLHEAKQQQAALLDAQDASVTSAVNAAVAGRSDPNAVANNRLQIVNAVRTVGHIEGWLPEVQQQKMADALNRMHANVVTQFLDGDNNPTAARAYFNTHQDEITGGVRTDLEKKLHVGELRTESQTATQDILANNTKENDALDAAKKKYAGDMQDAVTARIKDYFNTQLTLQSEQDKQNSSDAYQAFVKGGNKTDAIPASLWAQLPGQVQESLQRAQRADGDPVTNQATYYKLSQMPFEQLKDENLMKYVGSLSGADFQHFADLQQAIKVGAKDPNKSIDTLDAQTLQQQLGNVHNQMGWDSSDKKKAGQFDATAGKMIESMQRDLGRKLTQKERQGVIDELLIKGEVPSGHWYWPDSNKTFFEVVGTSDQANFVPDGVPTDEAAKIRAALIRNGLPVTPDRIQYYYNLKNNTQ
jgi:hypothetical protein